MAWFLNPALTRFRDEVNRRWPRRDKTSDGTIGDTAHQATNSDHNPDSDGSVDAWDMDVDGVDVAACKRAFQAHVAAYYWIHNDRICFRDEGWQPRSYAYAGPNRNRHDKHVHWNSRQSHERSTKPWFTEVDVADADEIATEVIKRMGGLFGRVEATFTNRPTNPSSNPDPAKQERNGLRAALEGLAAGQAAILAALSQVDDQVVARLGAVATPEEQAEILRAVLGERAKEVGLLLAQG
ncbi:hypothetical protein [Asanoa iriomotensis]|uniref:Uncharacterized protein n=1 Tax=Asanoa iriomotensis TaxID=234613 RepID=A0ABQ4CAW9_9ACTN|nr:hypothetical protein [Asanoa iriomotensis]GIF59926.1 hypothetical protein Air01nite_60210 [Asanoa iriomotensis]